MKRLATVEGGRLELSGLESFEGKRVRVTVEFEQGRRSNQQNRYYWKQVVGAFQELWSKARTAVGLPGYTKDDVHSVLVQVILGSEDGPLPGTRVYKHTRDLSTKDFSRLIDEARHIALHDYGRYIPEAGEPSEVDDVE